MSELENKAAIFADENWSSYYDDDICDYKYAWSEAYDDYMRNTNAT